MRKRLLKRVLNYLVFGLCWVAIAMGLGIFLVSKFNYNLKDVLFIEGMILIIFGVLGIMGGDSKGISLMGLGSMNSQYISNANLEITKHERENNNYNLKVILNIGRSTFSLLTGGVLSIVADLFV